MLGPRADYEGCESHMFMWTFGPEPGHAYVDACYVQLDISELQKYYNFVPIAGTNPDTRQAIDANRDGIGDGIRRNARIHNNRIYWGDRCAISALRIQQQGCTNLGDNQRSGGCDWISIQIKAKPGVSGRKVELTPIWHLRRADGSEENFAARTFVTATGGQQCN
jgi:hypothetical protein